MVTDGMGLLMGGSDGVRRSVCILRMVRQETWPLQARPLTDGWQTLCLPHIVSYGARAFRPTDLRK